MPIAEHRKQLYSDDWPEISQRVREEAGQRCEHCNAPNGEHVVRCTEEPGAYGELWFDPDGVPGCTWHNVRGELIKPKYDPSWDVMSDCDDLPEGMRWVKIVLTVAHVDQDATNNARENLRALCQRCHFELDRTPEARRRRMELEAHIAPQVDMFL